MTMLRYETPPLKSILKQDETANALGLVRGAFNAWVVWLCFAMVLFAVVFVGRPIWERLATPQKPPVETDVRQLLDSLRKRHGHPIR